MENVIIVGCIPGPTEPKLNLNSYIKPMVDELLELWHGVWMKSASCFGYIFVRCALTCVTADLLALRNVCGFVSYTASMGCSKCMKKFVSGNFGDKMDYSGYDCENWTLCDHKTHEKYISEIISSTTEERDLIKQYGVRYSELLRLTYFDIVRCHAIDAMHNLLLGTAKSMVAIWALTIIIFIHNY